MHFIDNYKEIWNSLKFLIKYAKYAKNKNKISI